MSDSGSLSKELCVICQDKTYDLICTCGDKFDFTCIHLHVEQIGIEFQFAQGDVAERLLRAEQLIKENNCTDARTIVENWKRKRIQDINDITETALNQIQERDDIHTEFAPLRVTYNTLCETSHRVVHEQLSSMVELQQEIQRKSDRLDILPEVLRDDRSLDSKLQSKLNLTDQHSTKHETEPTVTTSKSISNLNPTNETEPVISAVMPISNLNPTTQTKPTVEITDNDTDDYDAGDTANIQRRNPTIISTHNDRCAGTVCCHENQLLYNDYNRETRVNQLTLIPDITKPTTRQNIAWITPNTTISDDDDNWIQDITYSNKLGGYLILNRSRLRFLRDQADDLEDYQLFPNRTMKRVTCNDTYIYLIVANSSNGQNGDEIIITNYNKEEIVCKTFRDIISHRTNRTAGTLVGELSDIAVSGNGQVTVGFRLARRQEVGVCMYNLRNDGNEWSCIKQLLLNECWHDDLSYTPRIDWCEKLNVFVLLEYMTSHLIMLDQNGHVSGECRFLHVENQRESPINLASSTKDWFCIRYESSINIHRLTTEEHSQF